MTAKGAVAAILLMSAVPGLVSGRSELGCGGVAPLAEACEGGPVRVTQPAEVRVDGTFHGKLQVRLSAGDRVLFVDCESTFSTAAPAPLTACSRSGEDPVVGSAVTWSCRVFASNRAYPVGDWSCHIIL